MIMEEMDDKYRVRRGEAGLVCFSKYGGDKWAVVSGIAELPAEALPYGWLLGADVYVDSFVVLVEE